MNVLRRLSALVVLPLWVFCLPIAILLVMPLVWIATGKNGADFMDAYMMWPNTYFTWVKKCRCSDV